MILKHAPEDFIVKEESLLDLKDSGLYTYWRMHKRKMTTLAAIHELAHFLHIPEKSIGFAGTKDKVAVTEQFISIKNVAKEKVAGFLHPNCSIEFFGYGDEPILLGNLKGNSFVIAMRDISDNELAKLESKIHNKEEYSFINFFGEQRFSHRNVIIGKLILQKKYKEAVEEIVIGKGDYENRARKYIKEHPRDFVGALKTIPRLVLLFFIHAYQSILWNEYVVQLEEDSVPLIGFGSELNGDEEKVILPIMQREGITLRDFVNPSFPEITVEGGTRQKWCIAKKISYKIEDDEFFTGKKKVILSFFLAKGSYATTFCNALFS